MKPTTYLFFGITAVLFVLLFGCLYEGNKDKPEFIGELNHILITDSLRFESVSVSWSSLSVGVPSNTYTIFDRRTNKRVKVNYTQDTIYYNDNIYVKQ